MAVHAMWRDHAAGSGYSHKQRRSGDARISVPADEGVYLTADPFHAADAVRREAGKDEHPAVLRKPRKPIRVSRTLTRSNCGTGRLGVAWDVKPISWGNGVRARLLLL